MPDQTIAFVAITSASALYVFFSMLVTKKYGNRQRVKEIQEEINRVSRGYSNALRQNNASEIKKYEAEHAKLPALLKESMLLQFKPLAVLLPFLFVLPWLVHTFFPDFVITLPFHLPIFIQHFERFPNWRNVFGPVGWFWVSLVFISLLVSFIAQMQKKLHGKK